MTRSDLLTELKAVIDEDTVISEWSQVTLLRYLAEGQDKFCEETGLFIDASNYTITLATATATYTIPDRVIQVLDVWDGSRKLLKLLEGEEFLPDGITGVPSMWRTDWQTGTVKVSPTPTATENGTILTLRVWRYSRYDLAGLGAVPVGGGTASPAEPELPSRFQRACVEWAAYKAFSHHDAETQEPIKAAEHEAAFWKYVSDGRSFMRRHHNLETRVSPNPVYRT